MSAQEAVDDAGIPSPISADESRRRARRSVRQKIIIAVVLGALSAGVSVMGLVGQSFSLRQARALEAIGRQLEVISDRLNPALGSTSTGSAVR